MQIEFYQTIPELNIVGRMNTPEEFGRIGLPKRMTGMTMLDIGCNSGAFMVEALKRGAFFVWGVENDMQWRIVCSGIFEELKRDASKKKFYDRYILYDSMKKVSGKYDIVLLLSVLHVTDNPQALLDRAVDLAKGLLIVEINDRLQKIPVKLPLNAVKIGENKDARSVWHIGRNY